MFLIVLCLLCRHYLLHLHTCTTPDLLRSIQKLRQCLNIGGLVSLLQFYRKHWMIPVHKEEWTVSSAPVRERVHNHLNGWQKVFPPAQICDVCHQATKRLGKLLHSSSQPSLGFEDDMLSRIAALCLAASRSHATIYLQIGHPDRYGLPKELRVV